MKRKHLMIWSVVIVLAVALALRQTHSMPPKDAMYPLPPVG